MTPEQEAHYFLKAAIEPLDKLEQTEAWSSLVGLLMCHFEAYKKPEEATEDFIKLLRRCVAGGFLKRRYGQANR